MPQKFERQEAYKIYYIKGKQKISPAIPNIHRRKRKNMEKNTKLILNNQNFISEICHDGILRDVSI